MKLSELMESLADLEHERWSSWMRWMFDNWTDENITRWKQQMITPYSELPEHSKESDRKEVQKTLEVIRPFITPLEAENERLREAGRSLVNCLPDMELELANDAWSVTNVNVVKHWRDRLSDALKEKP